MGSPRKLSAPDHSLETAFRSDTRGRTLLTKGAGSASGIGSGTPGAFLSNAAMASAHAE